MFVECFVGIVLWVPFVINQKKSVTTNSDYSDVRSLGQLNNLVLRALLMTRSQPFGDPKYKIIFVR